MEVKAYRGYVTTYKLRYHTGPSSPFGTLPGRVVQVVISLSGPCTPEFATAAERTISFEDTISSTETVPTDWSAGLPLNRGSSFVKTTQNKQGYNDT